MQENEIKTIHNLDFESAHSPYGLLFRIGTCEGQWGSTPDSYYILTVINSEPGNGHLDDVFQWFEHSAKRDNKNLLVLECMNTKFYNHLINKRGFQAMDKAGKNAIKVFNQQALDLLRVTGNRIIKPITLDCR